MHYSARLTSAGIWGWQIEILCRDESLPSALMMVELASSSAWTERGARRKAARMIRRRIARQLRAAEARTITIDQPPPIR